MIALLYIAVAFCLFSGGFLLGAAWTAYKNAEYIAALHEELAAISAALHKATGA